MIMDKIATRLAKIANNMLLIARMYMRHGKGKKRLL